MRLLGIIFLIFTVLALLAAIWLPGQAFQLALSAVLFFVVAGCILGGKAKR